MKILSLLCIMTPFLLSCQLSYYLKSGYHQALLIKNQEPIEDVLRSATVSSLQKQKLQLIQETKSFAETTLNLKKTKNYTTFVELHRPYVTHIVQVAYPFELKYRMWSFPIVGEVPYKGYFDLEEAKQEAQYFAKEGFDTYVRGVKAYSTLGWMKDPVLSSMLSYDEDDLVNLILHELTHSTLYIKNSADFNEQLAMFVGNKGTELFYKSKNNSAMLKLINEKNEDEKTFSVFINQEYESLKTWYSQNKSPTEQIKKQRFIEMQNRFQKIKFKTDHYAFFAKMELNNAAFLGFKTYYYDLSQFEKIFQKTQNMKVFLEEMKFLEKSKNPEEDFRKLKI